MISKLMTEKNSLWTKLRGGDRPVVIYGMGDGAAKIMSVLGARGIKVSGIFASDDFVRGQEFMSFRVERLDEVEQRLGDFTVLLGFATHLEEVIRHIECIAQRHELYVPDVNAAGDYGEVFDEAYLAENEDRLDRALSLFADDKSRRFFVEMCDFKLSGKREYLSKLDRLSFKGKIDRGVECYCDLGAYCGDTLTAAVSQYPELRRAIAFEPDNSSYSKLVKTADAFVKSGRLDCFCAVHAAAAERDGASDFACGEGRGSALTAGGNVRGMTGQKITHTTLRSLDSVVRDSGFLPQLIKYDVEGSESRALDGSAETIRTLRPALVVSAYHKASDLFVLPEKIKSLLPDARLYLRRTRPCFPAWEVEIVAL